MRWTLIRRSALVSLTIRSSIEDGQRGVAGRLGGRRLDGGLREAGGGVAQRGRGVGREGRDTDGPQPAASRGGAAVGRHDAGGEHRPHLQALEQPAAVGQVVHQLGVAVGQLVEVGRDAVTVERVGLDQPGRDDRATQRDLGCEVADGTAGDGAERLEGGGLELVDPPVGQHRGAHDEGVGVELDRAGQQPLLAGRGGADVLLGLGEGRLRQLGRVDDVGVGEDRGAEAGPLAHVGARGVEEVGEAEHLVVLVGVQRGVGDAAAAAGSAWGRSGSSLMRSPGPGRAPARWRDLRGGTAHAEPRIVVGLVRSERVPAVGQQHPGHEADVGRLLVGDAGGEHAQPAAALGVDGGDRGGRRRRRRGARPARRGRLRRAGSSAPGRGRSGRRAAPRRSRRRGGRAGRSRRAPRTRSRPDVVGDVGRAGELARPLVGGEPRELEDEAVAGGERRHGVAGLPVPGLDLGARGGDVDVEGQRRGGEQADGAGQAGVDPLVGDQSAPAQGVVGVVERGQRFGVRDVLGAAARLAEAALEPAGRGGLRRPRRGRRGAVRRRRGSATWRSSGSVRARRRGSPSRKFAAGGVGVVRSMVTMSEPRQFDGQPVLVTGRRRDEGDER